MCDWVCVCLLQFGHFSLEFIWCSDEAEKSLCVHVCVREQHCVVESTGVDIHIYLLLLFFSLSLLSSYSFVTPCRWINRSENVGVIIQFICADMHVRTLLGFIFTNAMEFVIPIERLIDFTKYQPIRLGRWEKVKMQNKNKTYPRPKANGYVFFLLLRLMIETERMCVCVFAKSKMFWIYK